MPNRGPRAGPSTVVSMGETILRKALYESLHAIDQPGGGYFFLPPPLPQLTCTFGSVS
jgi:hypothetical protein